MNGVPVTVEGLSKSYRGDGRQPVVALEDLTLALEPGAA